MKLITYKCNLCNDIKPIESILGIHWVGPYNNSTPTLVVRPIDAECHICISCAESIKKEVEKLLTTRKS